MSKYPRALAALAAGLCIAVLPLAAVAEDASGPGLGRVALTEELKAWDIDVRPDGHGVPSGKGSVKQGERLFIEQCAACHGEFAEGAGRWPVLAGGSASLKADNPEKTIGSYWPYLTTVYDYIRRAMPFGNSQSLSNDDVYAITAYLLYLNDVVKDDFVLSGENLAKVPLPNRGGFYDDDRETVERGFWGKEPCMKNCKTDVKVLNRARILDVTPENEGKGTKVD